MFIQLAEQVDIRTKSVNDLQYNDALYGKDAAHPFLIQISDWNTAVNDVFDYRPVDLLDYLEQFWAMPTGQAYAYGADIAGNRLRRKFAEPVVIGQGPENTNVRPAVIHPDISIPRDINDDWFLSYNDFFDPHGSQKKFITPAWKHIIYAYAIENTRVLDIFQRVLREVITSERLGRPNSKVLAWARNTEELFFTDRLGHWIFSPVSRLRDDAGAIRRNAYYRMLGMELNHGTEDGRPYSFSKPDAANREFSRTFEQILRETWRGYVNRDNSSGEKQTDNASLFDLTNRLQDMLRDRRINTAMAREEFYSVATLSWFHLTLSSNNEVIEWLKAEGNNAAERLRAIGMRVGLAPHTRAYNFFEMATELSEMLTRFEGIAFTEANVMSLYDNKDDAGNPLTSYSRQMLKIINHWSAATGRNLKEFVGSPGQYVQETSFAMSRSIAPGGNGYRSLAKTK